MLEPADPGARLKPGSAEVLAICRDVLRTPLGWDDSFADNGGHSIAVARLVQRLQDKGWSVTVRDLLSDCDTARKVADRAFERQRGSAKDPAPVQKTGTQPPRDEKAAKVLAPRRFTVLQFLFLLMLYFPGILVLVGIVAVAEIGEFFVTARLEEFIFVGVLTYLLALSVPFANLFWVMVIKFLMGGHICRNKVRHGVYPKWSRMHLRIWCIRRLEYSVLRPLATMLRSAPLLAWTLRRLGATVGSNLQCAHDAEFYGPLSLLQVDDNVAIQTGACISVSRWVGADLHIGPVHLESDCKIGMRSGVANGVKVGHGSWVTPLTPILKDIGPGEIWDGAPAHCARPSHHAAKIC